MSSGREAPVTSAKDEAGSTRRQGEQGNKLPSVLTVKVVTPGQGTRPRRNGLDPGSSDLSLVGREKGERGNPLCLWVHRGETGGIDKPSGRWMLSKICSLMPRYSSMKYSWAIQRESAAGSGGGQDVGR